MSVSRDKIIFVEMVKMTKNGCSSWIAEMCDRFYDLSYPQKRGLLGFFVSLEIGGESWEKNFSDEAMWLKCWVNIVTYFTGREDIKNEPDREEFLNLLKDYFSSTNYKDATNEVELKEDKKDFDDLLEDLHE